MAGFITVERDLWEDDFFKSEPMTEREAWLWMIQRAAWKDTTHKIKGQEVPVPRGSFFCTLRELQSAFMWQSDKRVRSFLKRLENGRMVGRKTDASPDAKKTQITICNYDKFQTPGRKVDAGTDAQWTQDGRTKGTSKQITRDTNVSQRAGENAPAPKPSAATILSEVQGVSDEAAVAFVAYRKGQKKPLTPTAATRLAKGLSTIFENGGDPTDALAMAEERGWQTVRSDWYFREEAKNDNRTHGKGRSQGGFVPDAAQPRRSGQGGGLTDALLRHCAPPEVSPHWPGGEAGPEGRGLRVVGES